MDKTLVIHSSNSNNIAIILLYALYLQILLENLLVLLKNYVDLCPKKKNVLKFVKFVFEINCFQQITNYVKKHFFFIKHHHLRITLSYSRHYFTIVLFQLYVTQYTRTYVATTLSPDTSPYFTSTC